MTFESFFWSLYQSSLGPNYEFWHADKVSGAEKEDDFFETTWRACQCWESQTYESMVKSLGKTPFIWGLRHLARKYMLDQLEPGLSREEFLASYPPLSGICPLHSEDYVYKELFDSLLDVSLSVFGLLEDSPQKAPEYESDMVRHFHWFFPFSSMTVRVRHRLRSLARSKFHELTGEQYTGQMPVEQEGGSVISWMPYYIKRGLDIFHTI